MTNEQRIGESIAERMESAKRPLTIGDIENLRQIIREEIESYNSQQPKRLKFATNNRAAILTKDTNYELWRSKFIIDLKASGGQHLIENATDDEDDAAAVAALLGRLDEEHHAMVTEAKNLKQALEKLDEYRAPKGLLAATGWWEKLHTLKFKPSDETAAQFLTRYEQIIRQLSRLGEQVTEIEKKRILLIAVSGTCPNVVTRETAKSAVTPGGLSSEEICSALREDEHLVQTVKEKEVRPDEKALLSRPLCTNCGMHGHQRHTCRNGDRKLCYNCHSLTRTHRSSNCPYRKVNQNRDQEKENRSNNRDRDGRLSQNRSSEEEKNRSSSQDNRENREAKGRKIFKRKLRKIYKPVKKANEQARLAATDCVVIDNEEYYVLYVEDEDNDTEQALTNEVEGKTFKPSKINNERIFRFVVDSGATTHFCNDLKYLVNIEKLSTPRRTQGANKNTLADIYIFRKGDLIYRNKNRLGKISNILYSPNISENLFSLKRIVSDKNATVVMDKNKINIYDQNNQIIKTGKVQGKFWTLDFEVADPTRANFDQIYMNSVKNSNGGSILHDHGYSHPPLEIPEIQNINVNNPPVTRENMIENVETDETVEIDSITSQNIEPKTKLRDYLQNESEMNIKDLYELDNAKVEGLRNRIGLLWHLRLNHASKSYLEAASKIIPCLKNIKFTDDIFDCVECKLGKISKQPSNTTRCRRSKLLTLVHSDLMGPINPSSFERKSRYIVTFIDDFSRYAVAYGIIDKTQVHMAFNQFLREMRAILGVDSRIGALRIDGGKEYMTPMMKRTLMDERVITQVAEPYTPTHNGTAERFNREIQEKVRTLLISAKMPTVFWNYALTQMIHVYNRTPKASIQFKTPYELVHNKQPNLNYIRRFGCLTVVLDMANRHRTKFADRGKIGFLLQCNDTGYTVFLPNSCDVLRTKHIECIESKVYGDFVDTEFKLKTYDQSQMSSLHTLSWDYREGGSNISHSEIPKNKINNKNKETSAINPVFPTVDIDSVHVDPTAAETKKLLNQAINENVIEEDEFSLMCEQSDPLTYKEAVNENNPNANKWRESIKSEFDSLKKNETWTLVEKKEVPRGTKIISSRWIFKVKSEPNSVRYKSRLVIRGYADKNIYDINETYAPVSTIADVRLMLSAANKFDLEITQMDVKTAFLNGSLEKEVYMEIPEGYDCDDDTRINKVCKLNRALYGLKVSPRRWYEKFRVTMDKMTFRVYPFQSCIFVWRRKDKFTILLLYVDDILIIGNCPDKIRETKKRLSKEFEMTDLGEPKKFLGIQIMRDRENKIIKLSQTEYIKSMLERFKMNNSKPVKTPIVTNEAEKKRMIDQDKKNEESIKEIPFREAIGSLLYLASATRPDITYAVNALSRRQSNFDNEDWIKVKRVFRYLKGTTNLGLIYKGMTDDIVCYADASLGTNDSEGRSTTGYAVKVFGDLITWRTKRQTHVALSSAEAEFIAMSVACKELTYISEMCKRIFERTIIPTLYEDNMAALKLAKNSDSQTFKHIVKLCYFYVRLEIQNKNLEIKWISTKEQLGDFFTKALPQSSFEKFREQLIQEM